MVACMFSRHVPFKEVISMAEKNIQICIEVRYDTEEIRLPRIKKAIWALEKQLPIGISDVDKVSEW